jgi:hypothetical protein
VLLASIVEQAGQQEVAIADAVGAQRSDDIEAMASIGDMHRVEQGELRRRQPADQRRALLGRDTRPQVGPELAGLRCPEGG